jgi:hypothetical protein
MLKSWFRRVAAMFFYFELISLGMLQHDWELLQCRLHFPAVGDPRRSWRRTRHALPQGTGRHQRVPPRRMFEMFMLFSGYVASKSCECCKSRIDVAYVAMTLHECCINISDASSRGRGEGRGSPVPSRHAAPRCCHGRRCIHSSVRSPRHHHAWADA